MNQSSNFRKIKPIIGLFVVLAAAALAGCGSSLTESDLNSNGLPKQKYLVGTSNSIDWFAPCDGTAYVVDLKSSEIHRIHSLKSGEKFTVTNNVPLIKPALYFIPK